MVSSSVVSDDMRAIGLQLFDPCILLINFALLQYVVVFYWTRRHEWRVILLFTVGAVGVACIVPFANPNVQFTTGLNDISELCCALVFLIQITILGRDLNKKIRFKTVLYLTWVAEALIAADFMMIVFSIISMAKHDWLGKSHEALDEEVPNIVENLNLAFILFFRFFYTVQSRGWREVVTKRKREMLWYVLFATHEVPFAIIEGVSTLPWETFQAMWNRVTLAGCLYITANAKLRNRGSSSGSNADSTSSRVQASRRSSAGQMKHISAKRHVYVVASRTASIDRTSVAPMKKELAE